MSLSARRQEVPVTIPTVPAPDSMGTRQGQKTTDPGQQGRAGTALYFPQGEQQEDELSDMEKYILAFRYMCFCYYCV